MTLENFSCNLYVTVVIRWRKERANANACSCVEHQMTNYNFLNSFFDLCSQESFFCPTLFKLKLQDEKLMDSSIIHDDTAKIVDEFIMFDVRWRMISKADILLELTLIRHSSSTMQIIKRFSH